MLAFLNLIKMILQFIPLSMGFLLPAITASFSVISKKESCRKLLVFVAQLSPAFLSQATTTCTINRYGPLCHPVCIYSSHWMHKLFRADKVIPRCNNNIFEDYYNCGILTSISGRHVSHWLLS